MTDFVCVFGGSLPIDTQWVSWLDEDEKRRLALIVDHAEDVYCARLGSANFCGHQNGPFFNDPSSGILLQYSSPHDRQNLSHSEDHQNNQNLTAHSICHEHLRVKIYPLESHLQLDLIAKQVAWQAVFLEMKVVAAHGEDALFNTFKKLLEYYHLGANLILSDAADCGLSVFQNMFSRNCRPTRSALALKGSFTNIPAIIVGAGPSLEKNKHLLKPLSERALILAGGAALNLLDFAPHFAASIDREAPLIQFQQMSFWQTPFCFQSRMNLDNFSNLTGEAFLAPDSHFSFVNWLGGEEGSFDGGWTVSNFLAALAVCWGCNPIVFVGQDFCYQGDQKYAYSSTTSQENLHFVDGVWTQSDWLMAKQWTQDLAQKHSEVSFLNATEGGMALLEPIGTRPLNKIDFGRKRKFSTLIQSAIASTPLISLQEERWEAWKQSLKVCASLFEKALSSREQMDNFSLEKEIVYQKFLWPLWLVWRPIFERELNLNREENLRLNQFLFFQQAIEGQLNVLQ